MNPETRDHLPLAIAAAGLLALPALMHLIGLGTTSATEIVVFAIACMALNVLVGMTGLVSFGHGAWFGIAAYAAGLMQRNWFPGQFALPLLLSTAFVALLALAFGALILRRRGVYFSLLTLALAAMTYSITFRWTSVTGGEDGLGGITRPLFLGIDFEAAMPFYMLVAAIAFGVVYALWRFQHSPVGTVLVAIRENEQRARFLGYETARYKLVAFTVSAALTGLAGSLLLFNNRMTSAEPISVAFSGELLAMVVIGGMRSFLGPALGALFFVVFRDYLSSATENWLFWFGLLFVSFIVFSPDGLVGVGQRLLRPFSKQPPEDAAMSARKAGAIDLPDFMRPDDAGDGTILTARGLAKSFGGIKAVENVDLVMRDRRLHALIGPNGAGKTTAFNLISGMFAPDRGSVRLREREVAGLGPDAITRAGIGRAFQITNLFPSLSVVENVRLAVQARAPERFGFWRAAALLGQVNDETRQVLATMGLSGIEAAQAGSLSYGGQRLLDMSLALATSPRVLLLDEPLAGLAAAERERVGNLIRSISQELPVLLVEHDIDRVFAIADHVTVMNEGSVLIDGTVEDARSSSRVQEIYIGSGAHALAAKPRETAAAESVLLGLKDVDTFYGKSHILRGVSLDVHDNEIVALLGRNGAGKSTLLKTITGIAPPAEGSIRLAGAEIAAQAPAAIARAGIAYVPQGRGLFAGMSVKDNMELGRLRRLTGNGTHWDDEKIFSFFPRIRERWASPADYLSGGEQQMVAVARALAGDTRVLLLDEPFEGLAPAVVEELFEAFDRLRREIAIVIVDHHLDLALALSDRTVVLERGQVTHTGPSRALSRDLALRRQVLWL
ncbi:MAG: ATP-binding cassette domain-containing protein [Bosea sp.]|uniref:branched-chain amino acid ABC transporter ATP-binding protein/permease n=1 Tax=unclassified Bosea (in: a-proteobacteria) TaxID=2653178 RepID=UPI0009619FCC|nr:MULTISPECIES: branched-chain amino acid ABC transporter ATP-binding protein/permease [unclassified Bosea (in: a-proteobacteria)]MBN9459246.1 ATP-binding cassette domain-containing protein [Bosea sp. (in: a-proteobacteria)]OJV07583.1 MAG: ABC transporter [Bosea sp. 67-29]